MTITGIHIAIFSIAVILGCSSRNPNSKNTSIERKNKTMADSFREYKWGTNKSDVLTNESSKGHVCEFSTNTTIPMFTDGVWYDCWEIGNNKENVEFVSYQFTKSGLQRAVNNLTSLKKDDPKTIEEIVLQITSKYGKPEVIDRGNESFRLPGFNGIPMDVSFHSFEYRWTYGQSSSITLRVAGRKMGDRNLWCQGRSCVVDYSNDIELAKSAVIKEDDRIQTMERSERLRKHSVEKVLSP